jgi:hypothetical protein
MEAETCVRWGLQSLFALYDGLSALESQQSDGPNALELYLSDGLSGHEPYRSDGLNAPEPCLSDGLSALDPWWLTVGHGLVFLVVLTDQSQAKMAWWSGQ